MTNYASIFSLRSKLDPLRQPSLENELDSLRKALESSGPGTPYDKTPEARRVLMLLDHFAVGARGVSVKPPSVPYLYRFSRLSAVRTFTEWTGDREMPLVRALGELRRLQITTSSWIPLSRVAKGHLTSDRGFTWWSSAPLTPRTIVCDLHRRGMPNDWIKAHALLLRMPLTTTDRKAQAFTPTALDGFESVIFDARPDSTGPGPGSAINIEAPDRLCPGEDEFVLGPIPVAEIEFLPLFVGYRSKVHRLFERDLHELLAEYYKGGLT